MEGRCTGLAAREAGWGNGDADGVGERHRARRRARDWRGNHAELSRRAELLGRGCGRWVSTAWEIAAAWCAWCEMGDLVHVGITSQRVPVAKGGTETHVLDENEGILGAAIPDTVVFKLSTTSAHLYCAVLLWFRYRILPGPQLDAESPAH
ncbi:hypothetical protein VF21_05432 [Pseudogymnoascus sp. 05NY08]|nr:hypothetical protein VF21_05432 [Pseudogymnoascus sp. 05NY08]